MRRRAGTEDLQDALRLRGGGASALAPAATRLPPVLRESKRSGPDRPSPYKTSPRKSRRLVEGSGHIGLESQSIEEISSFAFRRALQNAGSPWRSIKRQASASSSPVGVPAEGEREGAAD